LVRPLPEDSFGSALMLTVKLKRARAMLPAR
jgi:hypothetical protein